MKFIIFISISCALFGCQKLSNSLSRARLSCGDGLPESASVFQVTDTTGTVLAGDEIEAVQLSLQDKQIQELPLSVSSKACIAYSDTADQLIVVRSRYKSRKLAALITTKNLPWLHQIPLQDFSGQRPDVDCRVANNSNGTLPPFVSFAQAERKPAIEFRAVLRFKGEIAFDSGKQSIGTHLTLPRDLHDGDYQLQISIHDHFEVDGSSIGQDYGTCDLTLDRTRPLVKTTFASPGIGLMELEPGQRIELSVADAHAKSLHYCFLEEGRGSTCPASDWVTQLAGETRVAVPDRGRWTLLVTAEDASGNTSDLVTQPFVVIQNALISEIKSLLSTASYMGRNDRFRSSTLVLRAFRAYLKLTNAEERQRVEGSFLSTLGLLTGRYLEVQNLEFPSSVPGSFSITQAKSSKTNEVWLFANSSISRVDASGHTLDVQKLFGLTSPAVASPDGTRCAVVTGSLLKIFAWRAGKIIQEAETKIPSAFEMENTLVWADNDQLLVSGIQYEKVLARNFLIRDSKLVALADLAQDQHREPPLHFKLSNDGNWLAVAYGSNFRVYKKDEQRNFVLHHNSEITSFPVRFWYALTTSERNGQPYFLAMVEAAEPNTASLLSWEPISNAITQLKKKTRPSQLTFPFEYGPCSNQEVMLPLAFDSNRFIVPCSGNAELSVDATSFDFAYNVDIAGLFGPKKTYVWSYEDSLLTLNKGEELQVIRFMGNTKGVRLQMIDTMNSGDLSLGEIIPLDAGRTLFTSDRKRLRLWRMQAGPGSWMAQGVQDTLDWAGDALYSTSFASGTYWNPNGSVLAQMSEKIPESFEQLDRSPSQTLIAYAGDARVLIAELNQPVMEIEGDQVLDKLSGASSDPEFLDLAFENDQSFAAAIGCQIAGWKRQGQDPFALHGAFATDPADCYGAGSLLSLPGENRTLLLAQGTRDGRNHSFATVFDFDGKPLTRIDGLRFQADQLAFASRGETLAYVSGDDRIRVVDFKKESFDASVEILPNPGRVLKLAMDPEGHHLLAVMKSDENCALVQWEKQGDGSYLFKKRIPLPCRDGEAFMLKSWEGKGFLLWFKRDSKFSLLTQDLEVLHTIDLAPAKISDITLKGQQLGVTFAVYPALMSPEFVNIGILDLDLLKYRRAYCEILQDSYRPEDRFNSLPWIESEDARLCD